MNDNKKLHIAYISYELPPDTSQGGIGTYTLQAALLMAGRGHSAEVFAASNYRNGQENVQNIIVHRIKCNSQHEFRNEVLPCFSKRHNEQPFDLIESAEINGNGYNILNQFPDIPHVVKLHTPSVFIVKLLNTYQPLKIRLRYIAGALLQGKIDLGYWSRHDKNQFADIDFLTVARASIITSPSEAMKSWANKFWRIPEDQIKVIANPYVPDPRLINLDIRSNTGVITFLGRLNVLKGLVNLTDTIEQVLRRRNVRFRIIGKDGPSHINGLSMRNYMHDKLSKYLNKIEFIDGIELHQIPIYLGNSDIVVIPSLWENFPMVCLEAMLAGRGIVAGNIGGMPEMLENGACGILVDPYKPSAITNAICSLLDNPEERFLIGQNARNRVLNYYNTEKLANEMENIYLSAILKHEKIPA
ncbi:MAG: glycosyltransferase family 4 protein [Bacteroidales bacterium]